MKKIVLIAGLLLTASAVSLQAQTVEDTAAKKESGITKAANKTAKATKKAAKSVEKTAVKVGNETAEAASNSKAAVTDQTHKDKVGPDGQKIYIDNHSKFYWIDDKGKRHYVTEAELKAKN